MSQASASMDGVVVVMVVVDMVVAVMVVMVGMVVMAGMVAVMRDMAVTMDMNTVSMDIMNMVMTIMITGEYFFFCFFPFLSCLLLFSVCSSHL